MIVEALLSPSFIDALCLSRLPQEEAQAWGVSSLPNPHLPWIGSAPPSLKHRCLRLARVKPSSPIRPMEVRASPPTPLFPRL